MMKTTKTREKYPLNQSALYAIHSKRRLCGDILYINQAALEEMLDSETNYLVYLDNPQPIVPHEIFKKKPREIQALKPPLKKIHKRIFNLIKHVDIPDYLHSAVKGRSYKTNASAHIGAKCLYRVDIKSFYKNISKERVYKFFADTMACSNDVAGLMARICCYKTMLPTGSPLSPIISFFVNIKMFEDLYAYAISNNIKITVYIDDVIFSGEKITYKNRYEIDKIIINNGYTPHKKKFCKNKDKKIVTGLEVTDNSVTIPNKRKLKVRILLKFARGTKNNEKREELAKVLMGYASEAKQFDTTYAHYIEREVLKLRCRQFG